MHAHVCVYHVNMINYFSTFPAVRNGEMFGSWPICVGSDPLSTENNQAEVTSVSPSLSPHPPTLIYCSRRENEHGSSVYIEPSFGMGTLSATSST